MPTGRKAITCGTRSLSVLATTKTPATYRNKFESIALCVDCGSANLHGKVNLPEVLNVFHECDPDGPLAVLHGTNIHNSAFLLFAGTLVHNQYPLALLYPCCQRERATVGVHRDHARELVERFEKHILPEDMHGNGQYETLASSRFSAYRDAHA
jgi:hypothetical protein